MPQTTSEWLLFVIVAILARIAFTIAAYRAGERHARHKMRAKLAQWLFQDVLHPVTKARNGKIVLPLSLRATKRGHKAQRRKVLSVVRRDTPPADTAEGRQTVS